MLTLKSLQQLADWSSLFRVAVADNDILGYLLCLGPRAAYQSVNYRWFTQRYPQFFYIDRIALSACAQRRGTEARERAQKAGAPLLCEVNIAPRNDNDTSLAFHAAWGFRSVGEQGTPDGKVVTMLALQG